MKKQLLTKAVLIVFVFVLSIGLTQLQACTGRDLVFTNVTLTSISSSVYTYHYEIKNIGTVGIPVNDIVIQNYVSTDSTAGNDAAAGGAFIEYYSRDTLKAGAVFSGEMSAHVTQQDPISSYPYLVIQVYLNSKPECDPSNNLYIGPIKMVATGTDPALSIKASIDWNGETKSFTVNNWPAESSVLQYAFYESSGILVASGDCFLGQPITFEALKQGLYILRLSDGEKTRTKRILH